MQDDMAIGDEVQKHLIFFKKNYARFDSNSVCSFCYKKFKMVCAL